MYSKAEWKALLRNYIPPLFRLCLLTRKQGSPLGRLAIDLAKEEAWGTSWTKSSQGTPTAQSMTFYSFHSHMVHAQTCDGRWK